MTNRAQIPLSVFVGALERACREDNAAEYYHLLNDFILGDEYAYPKIDRDLRKCK